MKDLSEYWEKAIDFDAYMTVAEQRIAPPQTDEDKEKLPYYELGLQRMQRALKTYKSDKYQEEILRRKEFQGKILIISEPWCGDASTTVPALVRFFEEKNETRIFLRDKDQSLINQFLTDGTQSIPKVLILNENFEVLATWGPRPLYGLELLKKFKSDPENYPKELFYNDIQVYYAKNKGKDVIDEILQLIP